MPVPTIADVQTCRQISHALVDHFVQNKGVVNQYPFAPDEFAKGKLGAVLVLVQPLFEPFDDMDKICATSDITVCLPSKGYATCRNPLALPFVPRMRTIAYSALVHEFTHTLQQAANTTSFNAAIAARTTFEARLKTAGGQLPPVDWINGYYAIPEELEAHAIQAAAEALVTIGSAQSAAASDVAIKASEAYQRIANRIGAPGTNGPVVDAWWGRFDAAALSAYGTWP